MKIGSILKKKFGREHIALGHLIVQDDGKGAYISHWDEEAMGQKKPTKAQLTTWGKAMEKEQVIVDAKNQVGKNILIKLGAKDKLEAYEVQLMFLANAVETLADIVESQKAPTIKQTKALGAARMMKKAIVDELSTIK